MKIIVLVKEVPDTYEDRTIDLETGLAARADSAAVIDEVGERALEAALSYADANADTEITVLTLAPEGATASIRKALAMGAHRAVHVVDDGLRGADLGRTAEALAAAITRDSYDLVLAGNQSTDGAAGLVPAMIAERLGLPVLGELRSLEVSATAVEGGRAIEGGEQVLRADLPAVVSVTEALHEARFANFKGIVAAKKKPLDVLSLADLGVTGDELAAPRSILLSVAKRPPRAAGTKITDQGDAGEQLAEFLLSNRLS